MAPATPVKKAFQLGLLLMGLFVAGMVTMAVGCYVLLTHSGAILARMLGGSTETAHSSSLPGLGSVSQLMNQLTPPSVNPDLSGTGGSGAPALAGVSPDMMKQAMAMMGHGGSGQGMPDISKMMAQLSPEAKQLLIQMLRNPDQMNSILQQTGSLPDPKN